MIAKADEAAGRITGTAWRVAHGFMEGKMCPSLVLLSRDAQCILLVTEEGTARHNLGAGSCVCLSLICLKQMSHALRGLQGGYRELSECHLPLEISRQVFGKAISESWAQPHTRVLLRD